MSEEEVEHRVVVINHREGEEEEEEEEEERGGGGGCGGVEWRTGREGVRKRGRADTGRPSFSRRAYYWGCFQVCGRMLHCVEQGVYRSSSQDIRQARQEAPPRAVNSKGFSSRKAPDMKRSLYQIPSLP